MHNDKSNGWLFIFLKGLTKKNEKNYYNHNFNLLEKEAVAFECEEFTNLSSAWDIDTINSIDGPVIVRDCQDIYKLKVKKSVRLKFM